MDQLLWVKTTYVHEVWRYTNRNTRHFRTPVASKMTYRNSVRYSTSSSLNKYNKTFKLLENSTSTRKTKQEAYKTSL